MSTLVIRDIGKSYGSNRILDGISIEAAEGEFIALVGPSGCGKSTLLRILAGLDHADEGSVELAGRDITGAHPADRNIAMVFQSYALYPHLTAAQNIAVPLAMRDLATVERLPLIGRFMPGQRSKRAAIQQQVKATATSLRIDHLLDRKPGQMSGGQRQRVALARALVRQPGAFLMDEPLSNLDANLRVHTRAEIVDLHRRAGVPTIYVTHDQAEALSMADRVAVMMGGKLLQIDTPTAIYNDPRHIEVAQFIGTPRINILDALVSDNGVVHFAGRAILQDVAAHSGAQIRIGIRPEHFQFRPHDKSGISGTVSRIEFLGSEVLVYLKAPGASQDLTVKLDPAQARDIGIGMPVGLHFDAGDAYLFGEDGLRLRQPAGNIVKTASPAKASAHV
ncbi:multiple sugar transport system ATP-binding protein [Ochrobactrum daejeonense]|uniref:Multiple sugar transport system ATP-binding protein n=1 Tax=Brucella daejeonensis TaxID=659015 RepID=A0A7W9AXV3_9HYPH|nr:ABC transporter ATP-binding protein [Brucella daejeonensis]MBB5702602.1 multiple sugar transport system ATP-binding protein [Brucella daejeonensis]NKB79152.1 ABC transporter ATP-binding protein [Brucella daejeonensis]